MTYSEFIDELQANAEPSYAAFHARLTPTNYKIMGVRVPTMRKIAKKLQGDLETFPRAGDPVWGYRKGTHSAPLLCHPPFVWRG